MTSLDKIILNLSLGLSVMALGAGGALANPQDAQVVSGSATITSSGTKLDVHQSSDRAVIDWRSFNIAPNEHTQFYQPSSTSFTLNRVNSTSASQIDGMITANGRIAIINPNGVYFGSGAKVDVGGLIATTADIGDDDFMAGRMDFKTPGQAGAKIVNDGMITARGAGLVGLVAPQVENNGVIEARMGKVTLASGDKFSVDMAGDGFISVAIDEPTVQKIVNTGHISADGGMVVMTAAAARDTVDSLIVNKGSVEARSVGMKNGKIVLSAGGANKTTKTGTSTVLNEGTLTASGLNPGETGGRVELLADHVGAMARSSIDVSGHSGGGTVLVGGDYQGVGDIQTARRTYVDSDSVIHARATDVGDGGRVIVWADDVTRYGGHINTDGGVVSGNGGFVEVSGKEHLEFEGTVSTLAENGETGTLLLDPTDITISNAVNNNVNGATPFSPTVDNGPSNLNVTTLQTALAGANVTVQTRATGAQLGDITVVDPISWTANRSLTLDAHNKIYINAAITARNALTLTANDVDITANLIEASGGANLTIQPKTNATTIGIAGGAGDLNLSTADLNFIQAGWNAITIGSTTGTGSIDVGARTWNAPTTIRTSTGGLQINGAQAMGGNALTLNAQTIALNATLTGTGALTLSPLGNTSVGLAGAAGTFNLSTAELNNIQNGFSGITIGNATSTQPLIVNAHTWNDPLTLRTGNANLQVAGNQTMGGNALSLSSRTIDLAANLTGTGGLTLSPNTNVSVGLAGAAGTYNLSVAELNQIQNGFSGITIGLASSTQPLIVNAYTWNDPLTLRTGNANIQIDGAQNMGANNLVLSSRTLTLNADVIGTGVLAARPDTNATVGIAGGVGTYQLTTAMLARFLNWATLQLGLTTNTSAMDVGATTWARPNTQLFSGTGAININGAQNAGVTNLTIRGDGNINLNADVIGTGTLTIGQTGNTATMGLAGAAGTVNLTAAELDRIIDGWGLLVFGTAPNDGAFNIGAYTWRDNVIFQNDGGVITISGAQDVGANNLTIHTDVNPNINATLNGTGILTFEQDANNTTMGLAGGAGTYNLSLAELANISDGWYQLVFGRTDSTVALNVNAATWNDSVRFQSNSGVITIAGVQDVQDNNLTIRSNANPVINAALTGTGMLTLDTVAVATTIGVAGGAGTFNISLAELANITDGWSQIVIGQTGGTGAVTVNAASWNDPLKLQSSTGALTIAGAQTMGANDLDLITNNLAVGAALTGTGNLTIAPQTASTSIGLAGGAGTLNLTAGELDNISNGWSNIYIGRTDNISGTNINAYANWRDHLNLLSGMGAITVSGAQSFGANNLTVVTDSIALLSILSGTGNLIIRPSTQAQSIGLAGAAGVLNLSTAELNNLNDGWTQIDIGRADGTGAILANAYANWRDPVRFIKDGASLTSSINMAGEQSVFVGSNGGFVFAGNTILSADLTTDGGDIEFTNMATLGADTILTSGIGDVIFSDVLAGSGFDLTLNGTGDYAFGDDVGVTGRLGDVVFNSPASVTAGVFNADNITINGGAGAVAFSNANVTGTINITANGITGTYEAVDGVLDSGAGVIVATPRFTTLDINGTGATLTPGYIGAPGPETQAMANLISIGGVTLPPSDPAFTFGTFTIGFVAPSSTENPSGLNNGDITTILRQPQPQQIYPIDFEQGVDFTFGDIEPASGFGMQGFDVAEEWLFIIDDLLAISPDLVIERRDL